MFFLFVSGEDLVPEQTDEAEEEDEGGTHPTGSHPHRGLQHLAPLTEQHGQQRITQVRVAAASVTRGRRCRLRNLVENAAAGAK